MNGSVTQHGEPLRASQRFFTDTQVNRLAVFTMKQRDNPSMSSTVYVKVSAEGLHFSDTDMNPAAAWAEHSGFGSKVAFANIKCWDCNELAGKVAITVMYTQQCDRSCIKLAAVHVGDARRLCCNLDYHSENRRWKVQQNHLESAPSVVELQVSASSVRLYDGDTKLQEIELSRLTNHHACSLQQSTVGESLDAAFSIVYSLPCL
jgi:hypothetical protein